ncbi:MAG TPA: hypothetical protein VJB34_03845 [Bdellovibrionota bacterium]|nr:hypothetical protein [Bdellovibrionota bacterium]
MNKLLLFGLILSILTLTSCKAGKSDFGPFESKVDKRIDVLTVMLSLRAGETAIRQTKFAVEKIVNSKPEVCEVIHKQGTPLLFFATKAKGVSTITVFDKAEEPQVVYRIEVE